MLLYSALRLMSRSGKNLIQIRGHQSQGKLPSSVLSHFPLSIFYSNSDSSWCSLFRSWLLSVFWSPLQFSLFLQKILKFMLKVYSMFQTWKLFKHFCFFHFSSFKLKSSLQSQISVSVRLKEWQEWIANRRTITP